MSVVFGGIAMRSRDRDVAADFYRDLGFSPKLHEHGGPLHFEMLEFTPFPIVEIYKMSENFPEDAIIIYTSSLDETLNNVKKYAVEHITDIRKLSDASFIYIKDPDGRTLLIMESLSS